MCTVAARNPKTQTCALELTQGPSVQLIKTASHDTWIFLSENLKDLRSWGQDLCTHALHTHCSELISQSQMKYNSSKSGFERFWVGTCQMHRVQLESLHISSQKIKVSYCLYVCSTYIMWEIKLGQGPDRLMAKNWLCVTKLYKIWWKYCK